MSWDLINWSFFFVFLGDCKSFGAALIHALCIWVLLLYLMKIFVPKKKKKKQVQSGKIQSNHLLKCSHVCNCVSSGNINFSDVYPLMPNVLMCFQFSHAQECMQMLIHHSSQHPDFRSCTLVVFTNLYLIAVELL